jgi:hypothetical protein
MKIIASIEDIRTELQRRIYVSTWGNGYCTDCTAPFPYRILHDGIANWTANVAATGSGCEGCLLEIIETMRREYDLPPQPLSGAIARLLSWRKHEI